MSYQDWIIVGAGVGFVVLAAILLVPVYLFLKKEEEASKNWTEEAQKDADSMEDSP